jgi:hypothetical protein
MLIGCGMILKGFDVSTCANFPVLVSKHTKFR